METIKHICPVDDWTCPYCDDEGFCILENPYDDCDDYAYFYESYIEEE